MLLARPTLAQTVQNNLLKFFCDSCEIGTEKQTRIRLDWDQTISDGIEFGFQKITNCRIVNLHSNPIRCTPLVKNALSCPVTSVFGWLDSTTALYWIKGDGKFDKPVCRELNEESQGYMYISIGTHTGRSAIND